jgi:hypothetical protein
MLLFRPFIFIRILFWLRYLNASAFISKFLIEPQEGDAGFAHQLLIAVEILGKSDQAGSADRRRSGMA